MDSHIQLKNYRVIVSGGRDFNDYEFLKKTLDHMLSNLAKEEIEIVEGGAKGADALGKRWAIENNLPYKTFEADWNTHGKKAGPLRNKEMAEYATHLIAFDTGGPGTADMIKQAKENKLKVAKF